MNELFPILSESHLSWDADFGRSGSSGFVGRFRLLRWSGCGPVPKGSCVPFTPYVGIGDFILATACYNLLTEYFMLEEEIPSSNYY